MLYEVSIAAQRTDFDLTEESEPILNSMETVLASFISHAMHKKTWIMPAIASAQPDATRDLTVMIAQNQIDRDMLVKLMTDLRTVSAQSKKLVLAREIVSRFAGFVGSNLDNMAKEEKDLNEILWKNYNDSEIMAIEQEMLSSIGPELLVTTSKSMMKALSNNEIIGWLTVVKQHPNQEAFEFLISVAEQELSPERWARIQDAIVDGNRWLAV